MTTLHEALGGDGPILALAEAWHEHCLADPVVAHAFSHGYRADHVERLAAYWSEALGGPRTFSERLGDETTVVRMHSGNGEHEEMDHRAVACFEAAVAASGVAPDREVAAALVAWFRASVERMATYPGSAADVPADLTVPVWPGDGRPPA